MAEHTLKTVIQLRYDTYSAWMNSNNILRPGEAAIATFPYQKTLANTDDMPDHTPPAIGIKIGDGHNYFKDLPWVQAISADVYTWAKSPYKPTYYASEIQGLVSFIEEHSSSGSGSGSILPRLYQIVRGTNENRNKYYLQYKEDGSSQWITDTEHYIDVNDFVKVVNWIGEAVDEFDDINDRTEQHIQYDLDKLNVDDRQESKYFVTAVSQTSGKIDITKKLLEYTDINGILEVNKGGTGTTSFAEDTVLIGNGTNQILTRPLDDEIANNNHLVINSAIKQYVDNAVSGIEGAMHFIGEATVAPIGGINPLVENYNFNNARAGDVVLWEYKEYVWTGSQWRLIGDEGSYAVKGSIRDADIDEEANIAQSKIYNLAETFNTKVDKIEGKGLSTNDYTDEEKLKLSGIAAGAQVNIIEHIYLNTVEQPAHTLLNGQEKVVELNIKEFTDDYKQKLDTIQPGAQVNTIESISVNSRPQEINLLNKNVDLIVKEFTDEYKAKVDTLEPLTIKEIALNGNVLQPDINKRVNLDIILLTPDQVRKLDSVEFGAQVNVINSIVYDRVTLEPRDGVITIESDPHTEHENIIEGITLNGVTQEPNNKIVSLTVDQDFIKGAQIPPLSGNVKQEIDIIQQKLQFARIAVTSNIADLQQTNNTYILIDCGSSTDVI